MRTVLARALAVTSVLLLVAGGCALFRKDDAQASGSPPTPSADGGGDAGADGGGPGVAAHADAGGPDWCAASAADAGLCDDFDRDPLSARWSTVIEGWPRDVPPGAVLAIDRDGTHASSPPGSLGLSIAGDQPECASVRLEHPLDAVGPRTELAMDVWVGPASTARGLAADVDLFVLEIGESGSSACRFFVRVGPSSLALEEQLDRPADAGSAEESPGSGSVVAGRWTRVKLTVDLTAKTVDVDLDGTSVFGGPRALTYACSQASPALAAVGIRCHPSGPAVELHYDNVVLTTRSVRKRIAS